MLPGIPVFPIRTNPRTIMPPSRAVAMLVACLTMGPVMFAPAMTLSQEAGDQAGDPERGRVVYRSVGYCVNCHGWAGDGKSGTNLQAPVGPSLRETALDREALIETIACGRPGTPMPYHDRAAYRDGRCFGMELADFSPGAAPVRGKTFTDRDVVNVVAFLETHVIGRGEPTLEECTTFYDNPSAAACGGLR
jgi:mono/diheme cytochrome c family protein